MRNLQVYPITAEETLRHLQITLEAEQAKQIIGGTTECCLSLLLQFFEDAEEKQKLEAFIKTKMP